MIGLKKITLALLVVLALAVPARATINFPASLDNDTTLFQLSNGQVYINTFHNNPKDAIVALETKLGINTNPAVGSIDYKLTSPNSVDPGHVHTSGSFSFVDGTAATPSLRFGNPVTDTNTGFFHPGTGLVAFASGGVEIWRANASGVAFKATTAFFPVDVGGILRIQGANSLCYGGTGASDNDTCYSRSAAHVVTLAGNEVLTDQATGDNTLRLNGIAAKTGKFFQLFLLAADSQPAIDINAAGQCFELGPGGASAVDTTICRTGAAAATLTMSPTITGNLVVQGTGTTTFNGASSTFTVGGNSQNVNIGTGGGTPIVNIGNGAGGSVTINGQSNASNWVWTSSSGQLTTGVVNWALDSVTGTKIGTATSQKLAFYNTTPIIQPVASTALVTALQNLGLIASGTFSGNIVTTGNFQLGTSGNTISRILTNGAGTTLDFVSAAATTCSADLTVAVTNTAVGDACQVGAPNGSVNAGSQFTCWVSSAGTVTVRHCNISAGANDPASGTFKVLVTQQP